MLCANLRFLTARILARFKRRFCLFPGFLTVRRGGRMPAKENAMTLMIDSQQKKYCNLIKQVSLDEGVSEDFVMKGIAEGTIVVPKNVNRKLKKIVGVGNGLKTKVNANLGTSPDRISLKEELAKLEAAIAAGADAVMDLSTGGDLKEIRKEILAASPVQVGTVPIYEAACKTVAKGKKISEIDGELLFDIIEQQCEQGVDFITVHCGINKETVKILNRLGRLAGVVSRGGSFIVKCINSSEKENPLYENYDRLLEIAKKYDVTLSLGDGFRPGCGRRSDRRTFRFGRACSQSQKGRRAVYDRRAGTCPFEPD